MNIAYLNFSHIYWFIEQLEKELDQREQKYLQDMRDVHATYDKGYLSRKAHMAQMIKIATDYSVKKELIEEQIEWLLCNLK